MKNSRDLSMIIVFAVLNFIIMLTIGQVVSMITSLPFLAYAITILYAINASVAWLMYEGRRWRILVQGILFNTLAALFIPSYLVPSAFAGILNVLTADLIFNSFYGSFKTKDKLVWWIILLSVFFWVMSPVWVLVFFSSLVYPLETVLSVFFIPAMSAMLPVIIIEAIAGGYIGYKIYRRVEKLA